MRVATLGLVLVLAAAAGCSKKPASSASTSDTTGPGQAAAPAAAPSLGQAFRPHLKPGLWEISTDSGRGITATGQMCIGDASDSDQLWQGPHGQLRTCDKPRIAPAMGGFTVDIACKKGRGDVAIHNLITGDFNSSYESRSTISVGSGAGRAMTINSTSKAKWAGPCPADLKPGHMSMDVAGVHLSR
jgi:hypothetical protein